jgi:hypothetical protein
MHYVGKNEDCKLATSTNPTIENIYWMGGDLLFSQNIVYDNNDNLLFVS